jgi:excinuclease UvrABC nuclease subunit
VAEPHHNTHAPINHPPIRAARNSRWFRISEPWLPDNVPPVACCYCVYLGGQLAYVGQAVNLHVRMHEHLSIPGYSSIIRTTWGDFADVTVKYKPSLRYGEWAMDEARLIHRLRPKFNRKLYRRVAFVGHKGNPCCE